MKSIKRGRGPSMMGGIASICAAVFGVIWTIVAGSIAGPLFAMFGVVFIVMAVSGAVYNFKNATGENRYSEFDIVEGYEEEDPLNEHFGKKKDFQSDAERYNTKKEDDTAYCPYCGTIIGSDFQYCHECGKKMPW